ncbi:MAG: TetR family transcriptional regulator, partial [Gordonia sp. (in: high G+C Gram-positive bacteria)]|uniref:TetR family transcriptional regulator n=1 Tax=Gordonia sp. (in: high G+C Gram-positive bacteria) TaxID=84139 RepID=UPI003BB747D4
CKEDAVLGTSAPHIPPTALEEFLRPATKPADDKVAGKERFVAALNLTVATMASAGPRPEPQVQHLISTYPELINRIRAHRDQTQDLLVTALEEQLAERTASGTAADSTRALVLLAGAVLRFAYSDDPAILDNPTPTAIADAVATFRNALKEIK